MDMLHMVESWASNMQSFLLGIHSLDELFFVYLNFQINRDPKTKDLLCQVC